LIKDISDQVDDLEGIMPAAPAESDAGGAASLVFDGRCRAAARKRLSAKFPALERFNFLCSQMFLACHSP
jgi:hypothetical protein